MSLCRNDAKARAFASKSVLPAVSSCAFSESSGEGVRRSEVSWVYHRPRASQDPASELLLVVGKYTSPKRKDRAQIEGRMGSSFIGAKSRIVHSQLPSPVLEGSEGTPFAHCALYSHAAGSDMTMRDS